MIKIDDNKPLPVSQAVRETKKRMDKMFKAYCNAYQRLYIIKPSHYAVMTDGKLAPIVNGRPMPAMSLSRMKQVIRNMNAQRLD